MIFAKIYHHISLGTSHYATQCFPTPVQPHHTITHNNGHHRPRTHRRLSYATPVAYARRRCVRGSRGRLRRSGAALGRLRRSGAALLCLFRVEPGGSVSCRSARMGRGWRDLETVGAEGVGGGGGVFDGRRRPVDRSVAV